MIQQKDRHYRSILYGANFSASPFKWHSAKWLKRSNLKRINIETQNAVLFRRGGINRGELNHFTDRRFANGEDVFKQEVNKFMGEIAKRKEIKAEQIVDEIAKIAFSKTGTPFAPEGDVDGNLKVNIKDKLKALDMLAKWLGLYEKDNKQKAANTQLLQVAFIGSDKIEKVTKQNELIAEHNTNSVWNEEMEEKKEAILDAIDKTDTPKEVLERVAFGGLKPRGTQFEE